MKQHHVATIFVLLILITLVTVPLAVFSGEWRLLIISAICLGILWVWPS
jgi:hypothetical protein